MFNRDLSSRLRETCPAIAVAAGTAGLVEGWVASMEGAPPLTVLARVTSSAAKTAVAATTSAMVNAFISTGVNETVAKPYQQPIKVLCALPVLRLIGGELIKDEPIAQTALLGSAAGLASSASLPTTLLVTTAVVGKEVLTKGMPSWQMSCIFGATCLMERAIRWFYGIKLERDVG